METGDGETRQEKMRGRSAVQAVRIAARRMRGSMTPAADLMLRLGVRKVRHD
jgi:hypothetical protein